MARIGSALNTYFTSMAPTAGQNQYSAGNHICNQGGGIITSLTAYLKQTTTAANYFLCVWSDSAGAPSTLLAQTNSFSVGTTAAWYTQNLTTSLYIAQNTQYWLGQLAIVSSAGDGSWYYYDAPADRVRRSANTTNTTPGNFPSSTGGGPRLTCIYTDYIGNAAPGGLPLIGVG